MNKEVLKIEKVLSKKQKKEYTIYSITMATDLSYNELNELLTQIDIAKQMTMDLFLERHEED